MHNTDRTQLEFETDSEEYQFESEESSPCRCRSHPGEVLNEVEEMELASELLEVADEQELDQFLRKFIKRIGSKVRKFVKSPIGGALLRVLKGAATAAIPGLGPVLVAAQALGSAVRSAAADAPPEAPAEPAAPTTEDAAEIFGLELEGLSPEDKEFEVARRFIRFGAEAVAQAVNAGDSTPPEQTARQAANSAAQRHAPGLHQRWRQSAQGHLGRRGRWERRGRHIILYNV